MLRSLGLRVWNDCSERAVAQGEKRTPGSEPPVWKELRVVVTPRGAGKPQSRVGDHGDRLQ